jgi:rhodanese-related sulfurtransferase
LVFTLPGAFAYSYLGHIGLEAATGRGGLIRAGLIAIGVLSAMSLLTMFVKRLRGAKDDTETMLATDALSLKRRLDSNEDLLVVDVRGNDEFNGNLGHIKGALNIPLGELPSRISELRDHSVRPIVVVCLTDKRSAQAIQLMQAEGHSTLMLLGGGSLSD